MRSVLLVTTLLFSALVFAEDATYSVSETTMGVLLADPAAVAVLEEHLPGFTSNPQLGMASGWTLEQLQVYSPDTITDEKLAEIQADLAALPAE